MFVCQLCQRAIGFAIEKDDDGERRIHPPQPIRIVVERRDKTYPSRIYRRGGISVIDPGGVGLEIVREVNACKQCAWDRSAA